MQSRSGQSPSACSGTDQQHPRAATSLWRALFPVKPSSEGSWPDRWEHLDPHHCGKAAAAQGDTSHSSRLLQTPSNLVSSTSRDPGPAKMKNGRKEERFVLCNGVLRWFNGFWTITEPQPLSFTAKLTGKSSKEYIVSH